MTTFEDVLRLEAAALEDREAVEAHISKAEADIAALDDQPLSEDTRREKIAAIRDGVIADVRDRRTAAQQRVKDANKMATEFEPSVFRRAALQGDAQRLAPLVSIWRGISTHELYAHLEDAVSSGNIGACEALPLIIQDRNDRDVTRFAAIFGRLQLPELEESKTRLRRVSGHAAHIDLRVGELLRGQRNSLGRLSSARRTA